MGSKKHMFNKMKSLIILVRQELDSWNRDQRFLERWTCADIYANRDADQIELCKGYVLFKSHFKKNRDEDEAFKHAYSIAAPSAEGHSYVGWTGMTMRVTIDKIVKEAIENTAAWLEYLPARIESVEKSLFTHDKICVRRVGCHKVVFVESIPDPMMEFVRQLPLRDMMD